MRFRRDLRLNRRKPIKKQRIDMWRTNWFYDAAPLTKFLNEKHIKDPQILIKDGKYVVFYFDPTK